MRILSLCLIVLAFAVLNASSQTKKNQPRNIRISIESEENTKLSNQVYSYFSRELRDLRDVEIVETGDFDYLIQFIIHPTDTRWALSYLITAKRYCIAENRQKFRSYSTIRYKLQTGNISNLKQSVIKIIAEFDATELKDKRESLKTEYLGLLAPCLDEDFYNR